MLGHLARVFQKEIKETTAAQVFFAYSGSSPGSQQNQPLPRFSASAAKASCRHCVGKSIAVIPAM
jgi:hypothetical protein